MGETLMLRVMVRVSLLAVAFALALPTIASAQSPTAVLREFGLLGSWATDCSRKSDADNFYAVYASMPNGNVRRTYYNTPDRKTPYNVYIITSAKKLAFDTITYQQEGEVDHDKIEVILRKDGNTYKIWSSVTAEGKALVKDGKFPGSGDESPSQTKCRGE
jgi:hypothetical protein